MRADRSFEYFALGRAGFGASPDALAALVAMGFPAWVEEQLKLHPAADPELDGRLRGARLRIRYPAGEGVAGRR